MEDPRQVSKRAAGRAAADLVESGAKLGLGTGSTVAFVLERLAERRRSEGLECAGVPTSVATAGICERLGIPLLDIDAVEVLDLAIDGADEIDPAKDLIKGGGGALTREKIVAAAARELVVVASADKLVDRLGATFRLPVEVLPFGWTHVGRALERLGLQAPELRGGSGEPYRTDNGGYVLDAGIPADLGMPVGELAAAIAGIPGVVEHGLFVGMATSVLVGADDGSVRRIG